MALALCTAVALGGCSCLAGPAGFWKSYRSDCVVEKSSDQGPWGGTRTIRWKACGSARFSVYEVKAFAERHGWELLDAVDVEVAARDADNDRERCAPGCDDTYPRFMKAPSIVMRFNSGWIRVDAGGSESTALGYAQIALDGSSMYVFHFWGDG